MFKWTNAYFIKVFNFTLDFNPKVHLVTIFHTKIFVGQSRKLNQHRLHLFSFYVPSTGCGLDDTAFHLGLLCAVLMTLG